MNNEENASFEEENKYGSKSKRQQSNETTVEKLKALKDKLEKIDMLICKNEASKYEAKYLLEELINHLSEYYDTTFLRDYLDVLKINNMSTISKVTGEIISAIEMIISKKKEEGLTLQEPEKVVLVTWLCASILWNAPRVPSALPILHELLPLLNEYETQRVAEALRRSAPPAALLELSDVTAAGAARAGAGAGAPGAGAGAGAGALCAQLRRAARGAEAADALLRERARGRELRAGVAPSELAQPTLVKSNNVAEIQMVLIRSKLQKLFKEDSDIVMSERSLARNNQRS